MHNVEVTYKVWIDDGYLIIRPLPDDAECFQLCTEPGPDSEGYFGKVDIAFVRPESLRALAFALTRAADGMEASE